MEQKLIADGKKSDFNFNTFNVSTLQVLLEKERGVVVEVSSAVNKNQTVNFKVKNITFLEYLKQGADHLNLTAIQLDQQRIILVPQQHTKSPQMNTPQVWSSHKILMINTNQCGQHGKAVLQDLGTQAIVLNENGVYGNKDHMRVTIKCVALANEKSLVYVIVAGHQVKTVEALRNTIIQNF